MDTAIRTRCDTHYDGFLQQFGSSLLVLPQICLPQICPPQQYQHQPHSQQQLPALFDDDPSLVIMAQQRSWPQQPLAPLSISLEQQPSIVVTAPEDDGRQLSPEDTQRVPRSPRLSVPSIFSGGYGYVKEEEEDASSTDPCSQLSSPAASPMWALADSDCSSSCSGFPTDLESDFADLADLSEMTSRLTASPSPSADAECVGDGNSEGGGERPPASFPAHILHMNSRDLKAYLRSQNHLSAEAKAGIKRQRRKWMNRVYAKRARDKKSLEEVNGGAMCPAQMQAKITRLQAEVDAMRLVQAQLVAIVQAHCPDALAAVALGST